MGSFSQVLRQFHQADSTWVKARAKLKLRFPEAPLELAVLAEPTEPMWPEARWRERIVAEADSLKIAEGQLRRAELTASRTRADKLADPTVGVFTASEAFRNERVIGISISIPFGGPARESRLQQLNGFYILFSTATPWWRQAAPALKGLRCPSALTRGNDGNDQRTASGSTQGEEARGGPAATV